MSHEKRGKSDEWYTPKYLFDALGCVFDMDVATPSDLSVKIYTPCVNRIYAHEDGLKTRWQGYVWMNPPYGDQKVKEAWLQKFIDHGNGIALMPDRSSAPWFQKYSAKCDIVLFTKGKVKFIKPNGETGGQPSNGTCLFGVGIKAVEALLNAQKNGLGICFTKI